MKNLKIASINLRNDSINRNSKTNQKNAKIIAHTIINNQFNIIGTQELTKAFQKEIKKNLNNYQFYGKYRFGKIPTLTEKNDFNENNNIITKEIVKQVKTFHLPWIPNNRKEFKKSISQKVLLPRIATTIIVEIEEKMICIINTHLSNRLKSVQIKQLNYLLNKIEELKKQYPVVLMGDFNMGMDKEHFTNFIEKMRKIDLKRVPINEKTHQKLKTSIDHIFIPTNWRTIDKGIIDNKELENVTDHKGIFVEIEIK